MPERKQAPSESASAPVTQRGNESCLEMENSPMRSDLILDLAGRARLVHPTRLQAKDSSH